MSIMNSVCARITHPRTAPMEKSDAIANEEIVLEGERLGA